MVADHRITYGRSFDFFKKVTVTNTTFGTSTDGYTPDIIIPFTTYGLIILNETPAVTVQVSFDGINEHDELGASPLLNTTTYLNRVVCKIWLKVASSTATVSVRAWSIR